MSLCKTERECVKESIRLAESVGYRNLEDIIKMVSDKDIVLVEGYKKSNLRKIEVYREGVSEKIITPKEKLIAIASNESIDYEDVPVVNKDNYKVLADLVEKEKEFKFEK